MKKMLVILVFLIAFALFTVAGLTSSNYSQGFEEKLEKANSEDPIPLDALDMVIIYDEMKEMKKELCAFESNYSWCEKETPQDEAVTGNGNVNNKTENKTDTGDNNTNNETSDNNAGSRTENNNSENSDVNTGNSNTADQNVTVQPCDIACDRDKDCSDANTYTIDVCNKDGTCESYCINLPIVK